MKKSTDSEGNSTYSRSSDAAENYRIGWEERRRIAKGKEIEEQRRILKELDKVRNRKITEFLNSYPPSRIEAELNEYIMDQSRLTKAVSDFLYYQALQYKFPELPSRPLLICGPSGSGKTEIWRVAKKLYSDFFKITFVNAANLTLDGWSGSNKLANYLTRTASDSILIFDEADKCFSPRYSIGNVNTATDIQAEFLKVIEDNEYIVYGKNDIEYTVKNLGVVFIGAFESIRQEKTQLVGKSIGFGSQRSEQPQYNGITRNDLLEFGVIPELLGRIALITNTRPISEEQCLKIVRNSKSRLTIIADRLSAVGIDAWKSLSDEVIIKMIKKADIGKFGFRGVMSKIETIMLNSIHENGLSLPPDDNEIKTPIELDDEIPRI